MRRTENAFSINFLKLLIKHFGSRWNDNSTGMNGFVCVEFGREHFELNSNHSPAKPSWMKFAFSEDVLIPPRPWAACQTRDNAVDLHMCVWLCVMTENCFNHSAMRKSKSICYALCMKHEVVFNRVSHSHSQSTHKSLRKIQMNATLGNDVLPKCSKREKKYRMNYPDPLHIVEAIICSSYATATIKMWPKIH